MKFLQKISNKAFKPSEKEMETAPFGIFDVKIHTLAGKPFSWDVVKGRFILFVNVASECGFTSQYKDLENLFQKYSDKLMVIGVPCNQFGAQEPGTAEQIGAFCEKNYGVSFTLLEKIDVKGLNQHQLYAWLTQKRYNKKMSSSVKWNFQKYLVSPDGQLVDFFYSTTSPLSKKITKHLA
ncbi:Glutathione peroxidase [Croceitalea dokdonensis DOKDO 023]|uniref:Glutathione peroxidase n=2 Tax=Croceitalea TaxID=574891 RepID=A0A0P7B237_9FLAO|nr:Glutathione peroxidase [Croceitalea dokdonensis DOKDO 023]